MRLFVICEGLEQSSHFRDQTITQTVQNLSFLENQIRKDMLRLGSASEVYDHQLTKVAHDLARSQAMLDEVRNTLRQEPEMMRGLNEETLAKLSYRKINKALGTVRNQASSHLSREFKLQGFINTKLSRETERAGEYRTCRHRMIAANIEKEAKKRDNILRRMEERAQAMRDLQAQVEESARAARKVWRLEWI